jgi:DNA invertase Pin-like site-specific DNA recombinase
MIFGYIRVSTHDQNLDSQKNLISRYCVENRIIVDEWIEIEISSTKSIRQRKIDLLISRLSKNDIIICSELSRIGRSVKEVLEIIENIVEKKRGRLILIKQGLDLNPGKKDMTSKVLITIFSMVAELERDFISERTKEGLNARRAKGITLGKPPGTIQSSMYDKDREKIFHLYQIGVPITTIIDKHLKYGKYLSLKIYIHKRYPVDSS